VFEEGEFGGGRWRVEPHGGGVVLAVDFGASDGPVLDGEEFFDDAARGFDPLFGGQAVGAEHADFVVDVTDQAGDAVAFAVEEAKAVGGVVGEGAPFQGGADAL